MQIHPSCLYTWVSLWQLSLHSGRPWREEGVRNRVQTYLHRNPVKFGRGHVVRDDKVGTCAPSAAPPPVHMLSMTGRSLLRAVGSTGQRGGNTSAESGRYASSLFVAPVFRSISELFQGKKQNLVPKERERHANTGALECQRRSAGCQLRRGDATRGEQRPAVCAERLLVTSGRHMWIFNRALAVCLKGRQRPEYRTSNTWLGSRLPSRRPSGTNCFPVIASLFSVWKVQQCKVQ